MQILYLYDLKAKNKREFNRVKRVFYYHLAKLALPKAAFITKSTIVVEGNQERIMDFFFKRFKKSVTIYKVCCESIEEL